MRKLVLIFFLIFSTGWVFAHEKDSNPSAQKDDIEMVGEIEILDAPEVEKMGPGSILGISKHRFMTTSGPIIWLAMAIAVTTRHLRLKGRARQLLSIHRFFGYTALGVGTMHGFIGLFY